MSTRSFLVHFAIAQTALALAACGDDSTGPAGDEMTQAEANALAQGLAGFLPLNEANPDALANVLPGMQVPLETTLACSGSGEAMFSGEASVSMNEAQEALVLELSGTLTPADCAFTGDGITFTLNGNPALTQSGSIAISIADLAATIDLSISGGFGWATGEKTGNCNLETTTAGQISFLDTAPTAKMTGSICGHAIDRDIILPVITGS